MVSRSLTEVYTLMRNNSIQSRNLFSEPVSHNDPEQVRLMSSEDNDLEAGDPRAEAAPPPWIDQLEEAYYIISRLRSKLSVLQERQQLQISRPALDDSTDRQTIDKLAADVGKHFTQVHSHVAALRAQVRHGSKSEQKLTANVVLALVTTLQDLSITYRTAQSNYLRSLTSREERSNAFFELPNFEELSLDDNTELNLMPGLTNNQTDLLFSLPSTSGNKNYDSNQIDEEFEQQVLNQKQMLLMEEDNIRMVEEREKEVNKVVKSIIDLQDIFKDLAHMVHEQGTVLDRIDYNIEQTNVQVHEGFKQLQKAERYTRKNRKIYCLCTIFVSVVVLFILLIVVKG